MRLKRLDETVTKCHTLKEIMELAQKEAGKIRTEKH